MSFAIAAPVSRVISFTGNSLDLRVDRLKSKRNGNWWLTGVIAVVIFFMLGYDMGSIDFNGETTEISMSGLVINEQGKVTGIITPKYQVFHKANEYKGEDLSCYAGVTYVGKSMLPVFEDGKLVSCDKKTSDRVEERSAPECINSLTTMKAKVYKTFIPFYVYNIETNKPYECDLKKPFTADSSAH